MASRHLGARAVGADRAAALLRPLGGMLRHGGHAADALDTTAAGRLSGSACPEQENPRSRQMNVLSPILFTSLVELPL